MKSPVQINTPALGLYDQFERFGWKYHSFKKDSCLIREIIYISASQNPAEIHSASINEFHRSFAALIRGAEYADNFISISFR
jgi:hypothetical protein